MSHMCPTLLEDYPMECSFIFRDEGGRKGRIPFFLKCSFLREKERISAVFSEFILNSLFTGLFLLLDAVIRERWCYLLYVK